MIIPFERLSHLAREERFSAVGVSRADRASDIEEGFRAWLNAGFHGEMGYLARNFDKRMDPRLLFPGARSVVSCLAPYDIQREEDNSEFKGGRVASFAWFRDYHLTIKERLYSLLGRLRAEYGEVEGRPFVDSAPLLDRYWATRAGLGWIGKNTLLVSKEWGSYVFIGTLVLNVEVETTASPIGNYCGKCRHCIDSCPTGALFAPGRMDARKCISYLTIEKKEELSKEEEKSLGEWAFGCDVCQNVCPWNVRRVKDSETLINERYVSREVLTGFSYGLRSLPKETCLRRANKDRLQRLLQMGNKE